jgi:serine acetyltransferase
MEIIMMDENVKLSFKETRRRMRVDKERLLSKCKELGLPIKSVTFSTAYICVFLYRLSRYMYVHERTFIARFIWQFNMLLTGADISPICDLGEGLMVVHPVAVTIVGSAGDRLTVEGLGGMGGGMDMTDIGAGPGLPVLGDDVTMAHGSMVLGPVRLGNQVHIGAGNTVVKNVPSQSEVLVHKIRVRSSSNNG